MSHEDQNDARETRRLHPLPLRLMHWLNAVAVVIMIGSGFMIYNDNPLFGWLHFPHILTIGGDPEVSNRLNSDSGFGGALQWHFAAMWLLALNGIAYLIYGIASGRFRRKLLPIRPSRVLKQIGLALRFRLGHEDITIYNAIQKLFYVGIILVLIVQVTSGLALWKPMQFSNLAALFYDFQGIRLAHFLGMAAIIVFLLVHVALALLVPRTLVAMVTGGPKVDARSADADRADLADQSEA